MSGFSNGVNGHLFGTLGKGKAKTSMVSFAMCRVSTPIVGPPAARLGFQNVATDPVEGVIAGLWWDSYGINVKSYVVQSNLNNGPWSIYPSNVLVGSGGGGALWVPYVYGRGYRIGSVYESVNGSVTVYSNPIYVPPPIGPAPSNLVLTYTGLNMYGDQAGTLSWSHNGNPNSYVVEYMTNGNNTPTANPTAWTPWTFGNIVSWFVGNYYRVGAVYASGTAYSDPILCDGVIPV
jgi:hypothetical protein